MNLLRSIELKLVKQSLDAVRCDVHSPDGVTVNLIMEMSARWLRNHVQRMSCVLVQLILHHKY